MTSVSPPLSPPLLFLGFFLNQPARTFSWKVVAFLGLSDVKLAQGSLVRSTPSSFFFWKKGRVTLMHFFWLRHVFTRLHHALQISSIGVATSSADSECRHMWIATSLMSGLVHWLLYSYTERDAPENARERTGPVMFSLRGARGFFSVAGSSPSSRGRLQSMYLQPCLVSAPLEYLSPQRGGGL